MFYTLMNEEKCVNKQTKLQQFLGKLTPGNCSAHYHFKSSNH